MHLQDHSNLICFASGGQNMVYWNSCLHVVVFVFWLSYHATNIFRLIYKALSIDVYAFFSLSVIQNMSRDMTKPTMWLCAQRRLRSG